MSETLKASRDFIVTTDGENVNVLKNFTRIIYSNSNKIEVYTGSTLVQTINGSDPVILSAIMDDLVGVYQRINTYNITYNDATSCTLV